MIAIKSVAHSYGRQKNLRFKDWDINRGEQWLLLGDSGSGKSTLLNILTGILEPQQGEVLINQTNLYKLPGRKRDSFRGQNIGMIFQTPHLVKSLTVKENLLIAQSFARLREDVKRIEEVLSSLGIEDKKNSYPHELSQGQLQRVSIARAVINKPALLVADEPTSSLDDRNTAAVLELLIRQSKLTNSTLVVATHDKRVKDQFTNEYVLEQ
ncbi:MAG: transporter ATP-binding protein [Segetibacter sp.]|nr:transporter ATP-binding protein [Segetibacter sp.]